MSEEPTESSTPSSKRVYAFNIDSSDQSSTSKKMCIKPKDIEKTEEEFGLTDDTVTKVDSNEKVEVKHQNELNITDAAVNLTPSRVLRSRSKRKSEFSVMELK